MTLPRLDDPVTVIWPGGLLVHGRWGERTSHGRYWVIRHGLSGKVQFAEVWPQEEGITWIPGHVSEDSDVGRALLAADAMKATLAPPFPGVPVTSGLPAFARPWLKNSKNDLGE